MTAATLAELAGTVPNVSFKLTRIEWEGIELQWREYDVTLQSRGRDYLLGELTAYPSGRVMLKRHHTIGTATARKAYELLAIRLGATGDYTRNPYTVSDEWMTA